MTSPKRQKLADESMECELAEGFCISRVVTGLWQIADMERTGSVDEERAANAMFKYVENGLHSFDMADHYGSAECITKVLLGKCKESNRNVQVFTKWVPDAAVPITREVVHAGILRSLERLGVECIDLLQFHWWDYLNPGYLDALFYLSELQREGKIRLLGLTNFDTAHLRIIVKAGIKIHTNQLCCSLLDRRAQKDMATFCQEHGIKLLCFGTIAGGLLSDKWLGVEEEPTSANGKIATWSAMKYKRYIDAWGGWPLFQELLRAAKTVAMKYDVSIANVAAKYVMQQPAVGAIIIGARLGESEHIENSSNLFKFKLEADDLAAINAVLDRSTPIPGDCGDEYRKPPFLTASGDLSHHVSSFPSALEVKTGDGKSVAMSGTVWEDVAGFSRAVRHGQRICVSGTTSTHRTLAVAPTDAQAQACFVLDKVESSVKALGGQLSDIVRTRIYVKRIEDWEVVAREHGRRFESVVMKPANTLVQAGLVGEEYLVEMEAEAEVQGG